MRITHAAQHAAPPQEVAEILCSEAYNLEVEQNREGVVATRFEPSPSEGTRRAFRLVTTEHARTKTGGLDRSRSLQSTTQSVFEDGTLTWHYATDAGSRVRLSGTLRVLPHGSGSRVEQSVDIEVSIPLVGGQIAKLIGKELGKTLPKTAEVLARHVASACRLPEAR